ncbi:YCF48-related protein [Pseudomonas sp. GD03860]|uniref:WD40/YVTN/BNR-like repeat-containing protein n=1 Tax=Pseudomonas TaxID=286 RepID=UPI00236436CA|nr:MULTISPECIES: YCF48-related protein [Pseudomonas]MDD2058355.1 YCF48-related protein [Pseudomonas putida]MDH0636285.1 YCF48-related protein [Pseudomonas sp. GD03860]
MKKQWLGWCIAWSTLLIGHMPFAADPVTVDPLEVPSLTSTLANSTQLVGIAHAGQRLVAVGWRGHILYSDDQGISWQQARVPVGVDLTAVNFPSPQHGWAVGHSGVILHSEDGGQNWVKQQDGFSTGRSMASYYQQRLAQANEDTKSIYQGLLDQTQLNYGTGPEQPWLDVWFENDRIGYVVGAFNLIMRTDDSGVNWTPILEQVDNPDSLHLGAISQIAGDLYIASERGTVFRREGERFVPSNTGYRGTFFGVVGNDNVVLAYGLRGTVYRSLDKGHSWEKVDTGISNALTGSAVLADGRIALVSQGGQMLVADPSGKQFVPVTISRSTPLAGVEVLDAGHVALIGSNGVQVEPLPASGS